MTDQDDTLPGPQPASALPEEARMPLTARRLVLIAAGCILVGILAGRFLFAGLILAAAGITVLAVALSYRAGDRWFSPLSWVVSAAGGLWTAATAGYWLSVTAATNATQEAPAIVPALSSIGTGSFVIMAGGVLAAAVLRTVQRRKSSPPE